MVKAILPTGQAIGLQFNLTSQGAAIDVMKNGIMSEVVLVQDQLVSTFFLIFNMVIWVVKFPRKGYIIMKIDFEGEI